MKRIFLFVMMCACAVMGAWAEATSFGESGNSSWEVEGTTLTITLGDEGDLTTETFATLPSAWTGVTTVVFETAEDYTSSEGGAFKKGVLSQFAFNGVTTFDMSRLDNTEVSSFDDDGGFGSAEIASKVSNLVVPNGYTPAYGTRTFNIFSKTANGKEVTMLINTDMPNLDAVMDNDVKKVIVKWLETTINLSTYTGITEIDASEAPLSSSAQIIINASSQPAVTVADEESKAHVLTSGSTVYNEEGKVIVFSVPATASESVTIAVSSPGNLQTQILALSEDDLYGKKIKITGTVNDDDLQNLYKFINAELIDLSEVELASGASITNAKSVTSTQGARTKTALLLPVGTEKTAVYEFQQASNTVAYYETAGSNQLNIASTSEAVAGLASVTNANTQITFLPALEADGTIHGIFEPIDNFLTYAAQLSAVSMDFMWLSGGKWPSDASVLQVKYLVVPCNQASGDNEYHSTWDPMNGTYAESVLAVSSYFAVNPYSDRGSFGGDVLKYTDNAKTLGFTYVTSNGTGHVSEITSLLSANMQGADVAGFVGTLDGSDLAAITAEAFPSSYYDLSRATLSSDATIAQLASTSVEYIDLPKTTTAIDAADFKSNVKEAVAITTDGNFFSYASASSAGTLETILSYDKRWNNATLNGTMTMVGTYNDVFGEMFSLSDNDLQAVPTEVILTDALFPTWTSNLFVENAASLTHVGNTDGYETYKVVTTPGTASQATINTSDNEGCQMDAYYEGNVNGLVNLGSVLGSSMASLQLPTDASVDLLPMKALYDASALTGELTIPANFKTIGAHAFSAKSDATSNKVSTLNILGAETMGASACDKMYELVNLNLPTTLKQIPAMCFYKCPKLKNVDLPEGIEVIGPGAFLSEQGKSTQIEAIRFPTTLKRIECAAFIENHGLTVLSFPKNLEYIGMNAFANCENITDVYFLGTETIPVVDANAFDAKSYNNYGGVVNNASTLSGSCVTRDYYAKMAMLHYPKLTTETTYKAATVNLTDYNAAVADPVTLYYIDNEEYVELTGAPATGGDAPTYYIISPAATTTLSTKPVANVWQYYSDSEGTTQVATPQLSTDYYYKSGEEENFTVVDANSAIGNQQYYDAEGNPKSVTLGDTWYYQATEASEVTAYTDVYNEYWSTISSHSPFYSSNDGSDVEATPKFNGTYYYTTNNGDTWNTTDESVNGVSNYYADTSWNGADPQITSHVYYKTTTSYEIGNWIPTTTYVDGRTYSKYSNGNSPQTPNWYDVDNKDAYYIKNGMRNVYSTTRDYVKGRTYYTNNDGTGEVTLSNLTFAGDGYYYYADTYTTASAEQIAKAELLSHTLYTKDGETYTKLTGSADTGATYYEVDKEGNDDYYGQYYTDLQRNANYTGNPSTSDGAGGVACGDNEDVNWPLFTDTVEGTGVFSWRQGTNAYDDDYAGLRRFVLAEGYSVEEEKPTPVQEIDHIKKDVWYTVCFPFDVNAVQLATTFGPNYELAEFSAVEPNDKGGVVLKFKRNVTSMKAHKAYMIHPASGKVTEEGGKIVPAETSFTLVGVEETQEDHNMSTADIYDFNRRGAATGESTEDFGNNAIVNPGKALEGTLSGTSTGNYFVFTAVSHSNTYDFTTQKGKRVLLPQWCFFLGTAEGEIFPKFYRQASADNADREGGLWRKNVAVVLPPRTQFEEPENALAVVADDHETWQSGFSSEKYVYEAADGSSAKALSSFEIMFVDEIDAITPVEPGIVTGIEELSTDAEPAVPAHLQGRVYSISGQYMGTSLESLQKGVYIVNGKKYLVK